MPDFIAEVIGQNKTSEGNVVTVRITGFGSRDGPMMTRAKGRAIASSSFGRNSVSAKEIINELGPLGERTRSRDIFADKSEDLFSGNEKNVKQRLKAFRKNGVFAEVESSKKMKTERVINNETLQKVFGPLQNAVSTYQYKILVTTKYSF